MARISCSISIQAPRERVFELFSDVANAAENVRGIQRVELLTDGPVGVGTRFRETRIFFNREATEEMEFTVFEPPDHYRVECSSHGAHYISDFNFEPLPGELDHTEVTVTFEVRPQSFFARFMSIFSGLMMKPVKRCTEDDIQDLKTLAES